MPDGVRFFFYIDQPYTLSFLIGVVISKSESLDQLELVALGFVMERGQNLEVATKRLSAGKNTVNSIHTRKCVSKAICSGLDIYEIPGHCFFSESLKSDFKGKCIIHSLTISLANFTSFLTQRTGCSIKSILYTFESHNTLKLTFTNI